MFQNAHAGIKKIFASEIMMLIASIIICVGAVVTLASISETDENPTSIMILGAIVIAFAIITLIAFILNIVGLSKAKKDEQGFQTAYMLTIAGILVSLVSGFFSNNENISNIFTTAIDLIWLLVTCFIIVGIVSLATKVNHSAVAAKGTSLLRLIVFVQVLSIVIRITSIICNIMNVRAVIPVILSIVAGVLTVVSLYLSHAALQREKNACRVNFLHCQNAASLGGAAFFCPGGL